MNMLLIYLVSVGSGLLIGGASKHFEANRRQDASVYFLTAFSWTGAMTIVIGALNTTAHQNEILTIIPFVVYVLSAALAYMIWPEKKTADK